MRITYKNTYMRDDMRRACLVKFNYKQFLYCKNIVKMVIEFNRDPIKIRLERARLVRSET